MIVIVCVVAGVALTYLIVAISKTIHKENKEYVESSRRYNQNLRECWEELRKWRESIEDYRRKNRKSENV